MQMKNKMIQQKVNGCLNCEHLYTKEDLYWCKAKDWPIPFAEERSAVGKVPCWCPLYGVKK